MQAYVRVAMLSLGVVVVSVAVLRCEGGDDDYDHVSN